MKFDAAAISDAGPRKVNEDAVAFWSPFDGVLVGAVADGLGGMGGGSAASNTAIATIRSVLEHQPLDPPPLRAAAEKAHLAIIAGQEVSQQLRSMATTLTAGVFTQRGLFGVHCGDSRSYIARSDGIKRLTTDHSEGERLFKAGKISKEELRDYPRRNVLDSALGSPKQPQIDTFEFPLEPGDKVFFTTDGLHGKLLLREIRSIAVHHDRADTCVQEVLQEVKLRSPDDNFTILAVFVS